jgi:hypothetical protein
VPLVILPFAVVVIAFVLLAMALTAKVWAGSLARGIEGSHRGGILGIITLPGQIVLRVVTPAVNYVAHELSKAASHYMRPLALYLNGLAAWGLANVVAVGLFAERTAIGFERLTTVVLPREIGKATRPINRKAAAALGLAGLTAAALRRYAHGIDRLLHRDVLPRLHRLTHAIDVTIPRALGRVERRVKGVETQLSKPTRAWLRRLAAALWAAGLLGLVVRTLARRFPWLFCRKVRRVGHRLCGLDSDLLDSLLADTLLLAGIISVVEFARAVEGFMGIAEPAIKGFLRETTGLAAEDYLG